jgi:hypothetical protein
MQFDPEESNAAKRIQDYNHKMNMFCDLYRDEPVSKFSKIAKELQESASFMRDELQAQLVERDAEIARLRAEISLCAASGGELEAENKKLKEVQIDDKDTARYSFFASGMVRDDAGFWMHYKPKAPESPELARVREEYNNCIHKREESDID